MTFTLLGIASIIVFVHLFLFFLLQLSPSFTPTSVIRKMYATKEKNRDEQSCRSDNKEDQAGHSLEGTNKPFPNLNMRQSSTTLTLIIGSMITDCSSPNLYLEAMDRNNSHSGDSKVGSHNMPSKDQDRLRPGSTGHHPHSMAPPGPSSFPRPIYSVPLLPHVPMARPPPQLHPNVVQRMLAQGIQPQQLGPALVQAGNCWFVFFPVLYS